jgi:hypothetical protein
MTCEYTYDGWIHGYPEGCQNDAAEGESLCPSHLDY